MKSSSGQYADLGLQLGAQSGHELSLRTQDDLLQTISDGNGVTATDMSTAQNALSSILSAAQGAAQSLTTNNASADGPAIQQSTGQSNLQQLIALANTTGSGGYVFGGENTGQAPLNDYFAQPTSSAKSAVDAAFQANFGFAATSPQVANITAAQMQSFLDGPFASQFQSPAWGANWSTASAANTSSEISPGNTIETSTTTNTAGFQQLAQGYTMLSEFGNIGLSAAAQQTMTSAATSVLSQGASSIIATKAVLGESQNEVTTANSAMSSQMTLLQTELSRTDSVDAAQVATQLSTLSTQLETAYQLTSQIHNLNLAQYLPT